MNILCVIPSRISSARLSRKPLLAIQGKPMIQWTYENAKRCHVISDVIVATDDKEIAQVIQNVGGKTVMTDPTIQTGTDRVAAVAELYPDADIVINLQGDEPFIKPCMLEQLVSPYLAGELPEMTTLARPLDMNINYTSPGAVKVIVDAYHNALYFSRSPIPYFRAPQENVPVYHHMGLYAFTRDFLMTYKTFDQTPLEKIESLEQLRVLENGFKIRVCLTEHPSLEINTPEEFEQAQQFVYTD
ncbi:MAG: kdsB [Gammaproteobacteria bacterium]|nr:kdsB [Gammaproteobacteria bacterium]